MNAYEKLTLDMLSLDYVGSGTETCVPSHFDQRGKGTYAGQTSLKFHLAVASMFPKARFNGCGDSIS